MLYDNRMNYKKINPYFMFLLTLGIIGSIGQSYIIHHELVDCYPYKMMSFPPASFYENIAKYGVYISPVVSITIGLFLGLRKNWQAIILPVLLSPLIFSAVFLVASLIYWLSDRSEAGINFDYISSLDVAINFVKFTLGLSITGIIIGGTIYFPINYFRNKKQIPNLR